MLNENIKKFRKQKGLSQEEMAVQLNVVRQTVSKWENALSVPDAEVLIRMADLLEVPVSRLLGIEVEKNSIEEKHGNGNVNSNVAAHENGDVNKNEKRNENDKYIQELTKELERVNEELARRNQKEQLVKRANEKRMLIWTLCLGGLVAALCIQNELASLSIVGICMLASLVILYRNLGLLTKVTTEDLRLKTLRVTTIFNISVLGLCIVMGWLTAMDVIVFTGYEEQIFATILITTVMVFFGIVSPKLPFTRHTGLRLPWTVSDEETWNLAHRIIGYMSLPIALLYVACALTIKDFETVTLAAVVLWIGIPGVISGWFYYKKFHG